MHSEVLNVTAILYRCLYLTACQLTGLFAIFEDVAIYKEITIKEKHA